LADRYFGTAIENYMEVRGFLKTSSIFDQRKNEYEYWKRIPQLRGKTQRL
jgi:hypothetical protein